MTTTAEATTTFSAHINRGDLLTMMDLAARLADRRSIKPVLGCVRLRAGDNRVEAYATDLECAVRCSTSTAQLESAGEVLVPALKLQEIVRRMHDDTVSISMGGERVLIRGSDCTFKLNSEPVSDYPPSPKIEGAQTVQAIAADMLRLIVQTKYSIDREASRYAFNGLLLTASGKKLVAVATTGKQLSVADCPLSVTGKFSVLIPTKALLLLERILPEDPEAPVAISVTDNAAQFVCGDVEITTNLIEGVFPPYEDIIPKDPDKKMTAAGEDLIDAIERAAVVTGDDEEARSQAVRFSFSSRGLKLTARDPIGGESEVSFPCKYEGADLEIGINPKLLLCAMRATAQDEVSLEMTSPIHPVLMRADFLHVVMPVNI